MHHDPRNAAAALLLTLALLADSASAPAVTAAAGELDTERTHVEAWREARARSLTGENGWLSLAGLFWLKDGENTFGRAASNLLVLEHAALADTAGSFVVAQHHVRFIARPAAGVTHDGEPVTALDMQPDTAGEPTVLASGSLRFFVIERAGNLGVRVRDLASPRRLTFRGLEYFPLSLRWVLDARFEPYQPARRIKIVNILGMEEELESPGAVVFTQNGREWRLDTVLESPDDQELFIMFADATSGHETYGAGRFLYIPLPAAGIAHLDFNKAYNPPCALSDFATCPLPPPQNRLKLRVDAGELKYAGGAAHGT